jgi:N-acetylglucosamine-6-phosphate deacetylase
MGATNYLMDKVVDHILGTASFTMPTQVHVKLHIGAPGLDAANNAAAETTRQAADWNASSGGTAALSATVTWTAVSTSETYSHFSIWDASSAGNPLVYGALDTPVAVTAGGTFNLTACPVSLA